MVGSTSLVLVSSVIAGIASAFAGSDAPLAGATKSFTVNSIRNEKHKPNGPAEYARALARWGVSIPDSIARFGAVNGQVGTVGAATARGDREYISLIGLGTPPQNIPIDLDTGSADLWVFTNETDPESLAGRDPSTYWHIENSTTACLIRNATWDITYGDGSYAYGKAWMDTVTIDGIEIKGAVIESAIDVSDSIAYDTDMSGVFGLAYNMPSDVTPPQPTVMDTLEPLLEEKIVSVDLKWHANGSYTFGKIDDTKFKGDLHYINLIDDARYWQFNFTGFHTQDSKHWYRSEWAAIADTGTSLLLVDEDVAKKYYAAAPSAHYNSSYELYFYPCFEQLPDFEILIGNWSVTIPGRYINYTYVEEIDKCMGGIQANFGAPFSILGDIFLKAVYVVFDFAHGRIGMAEKDLI